VQLFSALSGYYSIRYRIKLGRDNPPALATQQLAMPLPSAEQALLSGCSEIRRGFTQCLGVPCGTAALHSFKRAARLLRPCSLKYRHRRSAHWLPSLRPSGAALWPLRQGTPARSPGHAEGGGGADHTTGASSSRASKYSEERSPPLLQH
jgi:hypothetical protein